MNHPQREEWVPYLFGEADTGTRQRLKAHLQDCAACREELAAWKRSLGRLNAWKLPRAKTPRESLEPVLKWALAATVVLGLGFGLGRFSGPGALSPGAVHAQVATEVKAAMAAALQRQAGAPLAVDWEKELARTREEASSSLAALETRLSAANEANSSQLLQGVAELLEQGRVQDRQAVLALFRQLEEQHTAAYVALRKDLETLASMTDSEMQQARLRLIELAGSEAPTQ